MKEGYSGSLLAFDYKPVLPNSKLVFVKNLAWPAYAWRVIVPKFDFKIDALQRAILRLINLGIDKPKEISDLLTIKVGLVEYVRDISSQNGFLTDNYTLTRAGKSEIEPGERFYFDSEYMDQGWIFGDSLSGDIMPMFYSQQLPGAKFSEKKDIIPLKRPERSGKGLTKPSARDIVTAIKRYRFLFKQMNNDIISTDFRDERYSIKEESDKEFEHIEDESWTDFEETEKEESESNKHSISIPERIKIISYRPDNVDIFTQLYVNASDSSNWYISSPFGMPGGWWFRRKLCWAMSQYSEIKSIIAQLMEEAKSNFLDIKPYTIKETSITLEMRKHKILEKGSDRLYDAYKAEQFFKDNPADSTFRSVISEYQMFMECFLQACIKTMKNKTDLNNLLSKDNFRHIIDSASKHFNITIPEGMSKIIIDSQRLSWFLHGEGKSLRDRAIYLMIYAYYKPDSDISFCFHKHKDILDLVDLVADYRNSFAHYNEKEIVYDRVGVIEEVRNSVHKVVETFLNTLNWEV